MRIRGLILVVAALIALSGLTPLMAQENTLSLQLLGTYQTNVFDGGASEIAIYDRAAKMLFVVNGDSSTIDMLDISDPANPALSKQIDVTPYGDAPNSLDIYGDLIAVALQADPAQEAGAVAFFSTAGDFISSVPVGALRDMVTFTKFKLVS